jgi:hypothetical protein
MIHEPIIIDKETYELCLKIVTSEYNLPEKGVMRTEELQSAYEYGFRKGLRKAKDGLEYWKDKDRPVPYIMKDLKFMSENQGKEPTHVVYRFPSWGGSPVKFTSLKSARIFILKSKLKGFLMPSHELRLEEITPDGEKELSVSYGAFIK